MPSKPKQQTLISPLDRFTRAGDAPKERIVAASYGEVGTLKTSFWLGAPGPIAVFSLDHGLEGVVEPFIKAGKEIYIVEYDSNTTDMEQDQAIEQRDKFEADFEQAIQHARTIVWDKEDQVYDLFKYAQFGAPSDAPSNYYPLFQRYRRLINMAKASDVNFGLIQGMKTPWVPKVNKRTGAQGAARDDGNRVRRGMPEIEELVHLNVEHVIDPSYEGDEKFRLRIGKARGPGGRDVQNQEFPFMTFAELASLIFPDSSDETWQ